MIALNLTAKTAEEKLVKEYLEKNAGQALVEKMNNGVSIVKDDKKLLNKKTLETFMNYACEEARKQAEKGARFACVDNQTVFGWTIHYFEEDSIEGLLFNDDGTEYKKPIAKPTSAPIKPAVVTPPKPANMTLFDLMETPTEPQKVESAKNDDEPEQDEVVDTDEQESDIYDLTDF